MRETKYNETPIKWANITIKQVQMILECAKVSDEIAIYEKVMANLEALETEYDVNSEIWREYFFFYKMHRRNNEWKENFCNVFRNHLCDGKLDFGVILSKLSTECVETSFASKLIATLDDTRPLYDLNVRYALNIGEVCGKDYVAKRECAIKKYEKIREFYCNDKYEEFREKLIEAFDLYANLRKDISKTKKLDFVLWGFGKQNIRLKEIFADFSL